MSEKVLDFKVIASHDPLHVANFVHELTLRGYKPVPLQCTRQYGNFSITMGLYEEEKKDELAEKSTGSESGDQTTGTVNSEVGNGETGKSEVEKTEDKGTGESDSGNETGTDEAPKPVKRTRSKSVKPESGSSK